MTQAKTYNLSVNSLDAALIQLALEEDLSLPFEDLTTQLLIPSHVKEQATARIISKQAGNIILCGVAVIKTLLSRLSHDWKIETNYEDGESVPHGATILTITAPIQVLLNAERLMLNFLQHLSAIATLTKQFVLKVQETQAKILDTRKTIPGLRHLSKYAVQCGGGMNHRMGLYDAVMIKDTHIDFLGGIRNALRVLPEENASNYPVIVEVRHREELNIVLAEAQHKVTRVLLDNMSVLQMQECVALCQHKLSTEASGNITLYNVFDIAKTGVDYISIGKLTHSAGSVDLSMKCDLSHA